jgi:glutamyl-tRNA synthetase
MTVRTRMAPSPTGEYHIGHIRTVLYNYAFAKKNKGQFIIRIEDTDRERFVEGATDRILNVIEDYGFGWDEGPRVDGKYGPYIQSERLPIYKKYALELVEKGQAYYCFCTPERLDILREEQRKQGSPVTKYDRHCLHLSKDEIENNLKQGIPYVIRLKVPDNELISFDDEVLGTITINSNDIDDQVLLKSDGFPTYQLAVVIDDHLMEISHVMRGSDWIASTPKHVLLYRAFGWQFPKHIHLPNIKELGGSKKLSKRFGSVAAIEFLQEGYVPEALLNFLMFLGWNSGTDKEIYSLDEFVKEFSLDRLQKTDLVAFDREKLLWFNGFYIRSYQIDELYLKIKKWAEQFNVDNLLIVTNPDESFNKKVLSLVQDRLKKFNELDVLTSYFYFLPDIAGSDLTKLLLAYTETSERSLKILESFLLMYDTISELEWTTQNLDKLSHEMITQYGYKPKEAFMTLRIALTLSSATPPIFEVADLLGKATVIDRLKTAINTL